MSCTHDCDQGRNCTCLTPCRRQPNSKQDYRHHYSDPLDGDGFLIAVFIVLVLAAFALAGHWDWAELLGGVR